MRLLPGLGMAVSSMGQQGRGSSLEPSSKGTNPTREGSTLLASSAPHSFTLGALSVCEFGRVHTESVAELLSFRLMCQGLA